MADNRITINAEFGQNYKDLGFIGRVGENDSREIVFDCADALTQFPGASIVCVIKRACDTRPYSAPLTEDGYNRILPLLAVENAVTGQIMIELRAVSNDTILKSAVFSGRISESLQGEGDRPGNPVRDVLDRVDSALQSATETQKKLLIALDGVDTAVDGANTAANNAQTVADTVQAKLDNGDFVGPAGKPGSDASVTAENIQAALGYTPVKDVQVGGSSVLDGGVANVPIAQTWINGTNKPGVVAPAIAYGLYMSNGRLQIYPAETSNISNRVLQRPITPPNLDLAVKSAMCDGKGAAWTANEQKAARERMGVDRGYELIEEITISAGTRALERNLEPDGTAYNFRKMYVSIITPQAEEDGVIYSLFNNIRIGLALSSIKSKVPEGGIAQIYAHIANGFLDGYGVGAGNQSTSSNLIRYLTPVNVPSGISAISSMKILATANIPINTNIKIYGVRA